MGRARRGDGPDRRLLCGSCWNRGRLGSRRGSRRAPSWPRPEARPWGWGIAPRSWKLSRQVTPAGLAPPRVSARPGQGQLQRCGGEERVPGRGEGDGESEKACGKVSGASSPTPTHPPHPPPLANPAGIGTDMLGTPGPWSRRVWRVRLPFAIPSSLDRSGPPAELGFRGTGDTRRQARVSGAPLPGLVTLFLATSVAWQGPGLRLIPGAEEAGERRAWHCRVQGAPGV